MSSKNWMLAGVIAPVVFVAGCLVAPNPNPRPVVYAPPLPSIVVFETEQPYYVQEGYHYHYQNDLWYYSRSRSGPWTILPRDRCPREVRYRDGGPRHDTGAGLQVLIAPPLPPLVVFDTEPYYVQEGYHYHYQNDLWYYSRSRSGPWTILPRDRCPREVRYRDGRHGHDSGPGLQVLIAPPLPAIVLFDTEPYYVQEGYHYHYQNNGWYYSRSRSGPWTSLPKDRYPREVRYKDGRHGDDKGRGPQISQPITPDRHQEVKKPEHTFGSDRNRLDSATGSQRKPLAPTVERHDRVVTRIPEQRERVQPSQEHKAPVTPSTRHPEIAQPPKELKPSVTPSIRHQEAVQPPQERKPTVIPQTVQPPQERKPTVTQPVVRREAVVTPTRESRSPQPERVQHVTPPFAVRSGKTGVTPQVPPSQPVAERKDKTGKEQDKNKEHSR